MRNWISIALSVAVWCAIGAYLVFATRLCSEQKHRTMLTEVEIRVVGDKSSKIVTTQRIEQWLKQGGYDLRNIELDRVNTEQIRQTIVNHGFVKSVRIYTQLKGVLNIEVTQREAIARVKMANGYDFYISDDGWIMPFQSGQCSYVPIITGSYIPPFETGFSGAVGQVEGGEEIKYSKNLIYFLKLINFVRVVSSSEFWNAQIVQIEVKQSSSTASLEWKEPEIELVTRVGKQIVVFGSLDDVEQKLDKLLTFYKNALDYEGWQGYKTINLKYKNQVVCRM